MNIKTFVNGTIDIPNAFTPNGDGLNDIFYILGNKDIKMLKEFSIFNRWGQEVFQRSNVPANDPAYGWSGLQNGVPASVGAYVYYVLAELTDGTEEQFKGTVILIR